MKSLTELLSTYQQRQSQQANVWARRFSLPGILLGCLFLLSWAGISIAGYWHINFAWIAVAVLLVFYYLLDIKLAAATTAVMFVVLLICSWIASPAPTAFNFLLFAVFFFGGIALHIMSTGLEKSKQSLLETAMQLAMVPMALTIELIKLLKLDKNFNLPTQP